MPKNGLLTWKKHLPNTVVRFWNDPWASTKNVQDLIKWRSFPCLKRFFGCKYLAPFPANEMIGFKWSFWIACDLVRILDLALRPLANNLANFELSEANVILNLANANITLAFFILTWRTPKLFYFKNGSTKPNSRNWNYYV